MSVFFFISLYDYECNHSGSYKYIVYELLSFLFLNYFCAIVKRQVYKYYTFLYDS